MTQGVGQTALRASLLCGAVIAGSCSDRSEESAVTAEPAVEPAAVVDTQAVRNASYMSQFTETGFVELTDGEFRDAEQRIHAGLDPHMAFGDLDGDPGVEAAVIVGTNTGGSGGFVDLAIVDGRDGDVVNVATLFLGDRLRIHSVAIESGEVVLDATMHTPDDPMCCPSLRATRRFRIEQGGLVEHGRPDGAMDYGPLDGDLIR
jgi:hypothetical protein